VNLEFEIWDLGFGIWIGNLEFEIWNLGFGIWDLDWKFGIWIGSLEIVVCSYFELLQR
jgi:hypothetical protein